jgi:hypothetical protein
MYNLRFHNELTIYEQNITCHISNDEFNLSYNPTLLKHGIFDGSDFNSQSFSTPLPEVKDFVTSSFFEPYVTTVGLYNDNNELLAVAKLAQPIPLSQNTETTIHIKYDK